MVRGAGLAAGHPDATAVLLALAPPAGVRDEPLGLPMKKDRPKEDARPVPAPVRRAQEDCQAVLFLAGMVEKTSVDVPEPD
ncbi:hypothetical protein OG280_41580 (plasmid) [Streptomyces virginiae]|uniref:hypothetical protein n=1 Tax=Streptomyces virginiae TaxID=1961 RepID=UPI002F918591